MNARSDSSFCRDVFFGARKNDQWCCSMSQASQVECEIDCIGHVRLFEVDFIQLKYKGYSGHFQKIGVFWRFPQGKFIYQNGLSQLFEEQLCVPFEWQHCFGCWPWVFVQITKHYGRVRKLIKTQKRLGELRIAHSEYQSMETKHSRVILKDTCLLVWITIQHLRTCHCFKSGQCLDFIYVGVKFFRSNSAALFCTSHHL